MEEVYILNQEQIEWFQNRYKQRGIAQFCIRKNDGYVCIEKKYIDPELHQDIIDYIAAQNLQSTMVEFHDPINNISLL